MVLKKDHIDLVSVVESAGIELKRTGSRHIGRCPLHDDHDPSFVVFSDNRFRCFGCGESGDAIDLVQKVYRCDFKEALVRLGIKLGNLTPQQHEEIKQRKNRKALVQQFRAWERVAADEVALLCRCARKVLSEIRTETDLKKFGSLYHSLAVWEYHLGIVTRGDDQAKLELFETGIYGAI
jgi:DNA primase